MWRARLNLQNGMQVFTGVWFGQLISLTGSGLTNFALGVWVYQTTDSATQFALIALSSILPLIFISPVAGALVDRWDRRWVMIISDSGAALSTIAVVILFGTGHLETWHIYITTAISSTFSAFQWPAYTAAITMLVPKERLDRASGMTQFSEHFAELVSPLFAGILLGFVGLYGIVLLDLVTFTFAIVVLLLVRFPSPKKAAAEQPISNLLQEITYGWRYVTQRPGLLALLLFFGVGNFFQGMFDVLITPLILSFATPVALGTILSLSGASMVVASVIMSTRSAPKRRIHRILFFQFTTGLCMLMVGLRSSVLLIAVFVALLNFGRPIMAGSSQVIWQTKVPPDIQGRIFAMRRMIGWMFLPIAFLAAGPLADYVFEPLLAADGALAGSIGQIIGTGPGRGIGLLSIIAGVALIIIAFLGYAYRPLRFVEDEIPDAVWDRTPEDIELNEGMIIPSETAG
mgnify:CR=1 FL=1